MQKSIGPLGEQTPITDHYCPDLLHKVARLDQRAALGITSSSLPFTGQDIWHLHELSWLNHSGKPETAVGELIIDCDTTYFVESKSLKLYLNSLNNTKFESKNQVKDRITQDLTAVIGRAVTLTLHDTPMIEWHPHYAQPVNFAGLNQTSPPLPQLIDGLAVETQDYQRKPAWLTHTSDTVVTEHLYSNLMRSTCPVTAQPDWAQIHIVYKGPKISKEGLLKYIISYRCHNGFHEHCVEQCFIDILQRLHPETLTVWAQFTRRGGIAIVPYRR